MRKIIKVEYIGENNYKLGFIKGKEYLAFNSKHGTPFLTTQSYVRLVEVKEEDIDWINKNFNVIGGRILVKNSKSQTDFIRKFYKLKEVGGT